MDNEVGMSMNTQLTGHSVGMSTHLTGHWMVSALNDAAPGGFFCTLSSNWRSAKKILHVKHTTEPSNGHNGKSITPFTYTPSGAVAPQNTNTAENILHPPYTPPSYTATILKAGGLHTSLYWTSVAYASNARTSHLQLWELLARGKSIASSPAVCGAPRLLHLQLGLLAPLQKQHASPEALHGMVCAHLPTDAHLLISIQRELLILRKRETNRGKKHRMLPLVSYTGPTQRLLLLLLLLPSNVSGFKGFMASRWISSAEILQG